jgi:hypothetical protein
MTHGARQAGVLLRNALRLDFRPRSASHAGRWNRSAPLVASLVLYLLIGAFVGSNLRGAHVGIEPAAAVLYTVCSMFVLVNLLVEFSEILVAPEDGDILHWRPIASRTLYVARCFHVLVYVAILATSLTLLPALSICHDMPDPVRTGTALLAGAWLASLLVTSAVVIAQGALMRRLPAEKFQDVLAVAQFVFLMAAILTYQLLSPVLLRSAAQWGPNGSPWWWWVPPTWFARLPAWAAGETAGAGGWARFWAGGVVLVVAGGLALRRLAPAYTSDIQRSQADAGPVGMRGVIHLDAWLAARLSAWPHCRSGFEFFLGVLHGDRRLRVQLWTLAAMPLGLLLAALVGTRGHDPYVAPGAAAVTGDILTPAGEWAARNGVESLFMAPYLLAILAIGTARTLARTSDWRAAWVFHVAPAQRYDEFFTGIAFGLGYRIVFAGFLAQAIALGIAWRAPLHVAAHLLPSLGATLLLFPVLNLVSFDPPFTLEPQRQMRGVEMGIAIVTMLPIGIIAFGHYVLRQQPWMPILGGTALGAVALAAWWVLARRLRNVFRRRVFAA